MSYSKRKLLWYPKGEVTPIEIEQIISITTNSDDAPTNDTASVQLFNSSLIYRDGEFLPQENDIMIIYDKEVTKASETEYTVDDIIWTGKYLDRSLKVSADSETITLQIARWSYNIFNQFNKLSYYNSGLRTNEILEDAIKQTVESVDGSGGWELDFSNVASLRNNGSSFPIIKPTMVKKPMFEFITELGLPANTNSITELVPVVSKPMVFDVRGQNVYWYERPITPSIIINEDTVIYDISEKSNNQEAVTKVILDCGRDFNGKPIYHYMYNKNIDSEIPKEKAMKKESIAGLNETYDNQFHALRSQFTISTNSEFIDAVKALAESFGVYWFATFGSGKTTINVNLGLFPVVVSDLVSLQLNGYEKGNYVVKSMNTNSVNNDRTMTLVLEKEEL